MLGSGALNCRMGGVLLFGVQWQLGPKQGGMMFLADFSGPGRIRTDDHPVMSRGLKPN